MVSGKAALRAGSQRLVLRVGVVTEWPSDDPCDDVNRVPSCAMLVVSLSMPATPGTSSFITGMVPLSRTLWRRTNTAPRQREWVAGVPERRSAGAPERRSAGARGAGAPERGVPECRRAGIPERRNAEAVYGCRPAQTGHARVSFLFLRRSTTSAESATRLECVTTITHLPI